MASEPQDDFICCECGGVVQPFGTMGHWFGVGNDQLLCLRCAKKLIPERVAIAEAFEAKWNEPTNPDRH